MILCLQILKKGVPLSSELCNEAKTANESASHHTKASCINMSEAMVANHSRRC